MLTAKGLGCLFLWCTVARCHSPDDAGARGTCKDHIPIIRRLQAGAPCPSPTCATATVCLHTRLKSFTRQSPR